MATKKSNENVQAVIAYFFGFISGIIFLLISKDKFVRFHAWQSVMLFGGYFVLNVVLSYVPMGYNISNLLFIVVLILWVFLMIKAYQGEKYMLPYIGEIASKKA